VCGHGADSTGQRAAVINADPPMPDDDLYAVLESAGRVGDKENAEGQRERLDRPRAAFTINAIWVQLTETRFFESSFSRRTGHKGKSRNDSFFVIFGPAKWVLMDCFYEC
jgi:hypothetical protein